MRKERLFQVVACFMWAFLVLLIGYNTSDWQYWVITFVGSFGLAYIYFRCKDDKNYGGK